jgi:hypothetical protein
MDILKGYNHKVILMFDCCINTKSQDEMISHYGLTNISIGDNKNVMIWSSSLKRNQHNEGEDVGLLTHFFIKKYMFRTSIKSLLDKIKTHARYQLIEAISIVDDSAKLSL